MSWLSHFTNWVGEKSKTILPIVTGVAGFAAGMIPGVGGTVSKLIDKLGNKISGGVEAIGQVSDALGINGGGAGPSDSPAAPQAPAVVTVQAPVSPTQAVAELNTPTGQNSPRTPAASKTNPGLLVALGLGGLFLFASGGRR
jgi:hypothetical protein